METTPQEKKRGSQVSLIWAIVGMLATFMVGLYVGVHPEWIPVRLANFGNDSGAPARQVAPATQGNRGSVPQSQPTTAPAAPR